MGRAQRTGVVSTILKGICLLFALSGILSGALLGCADSPEDFFGGEDIAQDVDDIGIDGDAGHGENQEDETSAVDTASENEKATDCPDDPDKDAPGVCGCGIVDVDSDGDGTPDCADECPSDAEKVSPEMCGCGRPDEDKDGDGHWDCDEGCPDDPDKSTPGVCGCGKPDDDSDGDGAVDCHDKCPGDPHKVAPGVCGCDRPETSCSFKCLEAFEHGFALLDCGGQGVISRIDFASFGDPEGSCEEHEFELGSCDGVKSKEAVAKACLGQKQCAVLVEKSVLGDPHCGKGVKDRLLVRYFCSIPDV